MRDCASHVYKSTPSSHHHHTNQGGRHTRPGCHCGYRLCLRRREFFSAPNHEGLNSENRNRRTGNMALLGEQRKYKCILPRVQPALSSPYRYRACLCMRHLNVHNQGCVGYDGVGWCVDLRAGVRGLLSYEFSLVYSYNLSFTISIGCCDNLAAPVKPRTTSHSSY